MSDCYPTARQGVLEIPNCDDPVFRAWCNACFLAPGERVDVEDYRVAKLQELMAGHDPTYDPYQDPADDYLLPRGF